ncbi:hypothetical protein EZI54_20830 [Marinobacter halodurans]|uniref:Uncharacterized protein n=1 Tax=Marinobacter halodurans TaxID=2528979 RepID=A0ABY1ZEP4_9GAMM|nr:hypothetical protein [Marinobacter halodurans]TBW48738.1 hypothetical protein EZI54_20830 [Marinobacter halodurans]
MHWRGPLFILACVGAAAGLGYALSQLPDEGGRRPLAAVNAEAPSQPPAPVAGTPAPAQPPAPKPAPDENPIRFMLAQVADQYEEASRYPAYSVPISPGQAKAYAGNTYHAVTLPLADDGRFTVNLEKYRFTRGETILVVANLAGPMVVGQRVEARLESPGEGQGSQPGTALSRTQDGFYQGELDSNREPGEYRLIVSARVDGQTVRHVSTLSIEPHLGDFAGVGSTRIENNNLVIPVGFEPDEAGFYALGANLYVNGQPVAHLSHEQRLDGSTANIELWAHGSVMAGHTGKLQLKGLQIRRLPARPGDRTDYGFGPEDGFEVDASGLDRLEDVPAREPESEQRAAILRKMATGA